MEILPIKGIYMKSCHVPEEEEYITFLKIYNTAVLTV